MMPAPSGSGAVPFPGLPGGVTVLSVSGSQGEEEPEENPSKEEKQEPGTPMRKAGRPGRKRKHAQGVMAASPGPQVAMMVYSGPPGVTFFQPGAVGVLPFCPYPEDASIVLWSEGIAGTCPGSEQAMELCPGPEDVLTCGSGGKAGDTDRVHTGPDHPEAVQELPLRGLAVAVGAQVESSDTPKDTAAVPKCPPPCPEASPAEPLPNGDVEGDAEEGGASPKGGRPEEDDTESIPDGETGRALENGRCTPKEGLDAPADEGELAPSDPQKKRGRRKLLEATEKSKDEKEENNFDTLKMEASMAWGWTMQGCTQEMGTAHPRRRAQPHSPPQERGTAPQPTPKMGTAP
ncbi:hypothetical protein WISP_17438 [Willisornis vidua]|uniref:DNA (cytosine-5)-methyltransferase N-terminal domain-containing protein n=1 Tax=Willisornis vidua TaxID=1566151 RepID=A0ABQ9DSG8_9PASS|nr:hypothetical protein WISP_17438 [Willisornis vidua]